MIGKYRVGVLFVYLLGIASILYAGRFAGANVEGFLEAVATLDPWRALVGLTLFATHTACNALGFSLLNQGLGGAAPRSVFAYAWLGSLLAKYVPGSLWQIVGRGVLLSRAGIDAALTVKVGLLEQGASLAYCACIAGGAYLVAEYGGVALLCILAAIAAVIAFALALVRRRPRGQLVAFGLLCYGMAMLPYAAGYGVLRPVADAGAFAYALFAGTIAGVLALPIPGGIGVRESVTVLLLPSADPAGLLAALLLGRLLLFICEIGGTILGLRALHAKGLVR